MDERIFTKFCKFTIPRYLIYFLWLGEEIVYVGSSKNGLARVLNHFDENEKVFEFYSFVEVGARDLSNWEAEYIVKFRPRYNFTIPKNEWYKSIYQIIKENGIPLHYQKVLEQEFKNQIVYLNNYKITSEFVLKIKDFVSTMLDKQNELNVKMENFLTKHRRMKNPKLQKRY